MKLCNILSLLYLIFVSSCGTTKYPIIATGIDQTDNTKYEIKHVKDGCCGCSGILINTIQNIDIKSQLFIESNEGCPYNHVKYYFHYIPSRLIAGIDTLIGVTDSSYIYPITNTDKIALSKVDSFISTQNSSAYRIRKINITGYRKVTKLDREKIILRPILPHRVWH